MKKISLVLIFVFLFFISMSQVNALSLGEVSYVMGSLNGTEVCQGDVLRALKIVAEAVNIIKVLIPVVIILTGISSVVKAVMADDAAIKKSINSLIVKFFVGATIFFIPTIINAIYTMIDTNGLFKNNKYSVCFKCAFYNNCGSTNVENYNCNSLLGPKTTAILVDTFNIIKYVGIILCFVLIAIDLFKVLFSENADYKPVVAKSFKRIIYACILFFLPSIVMVLMNSLGITSICTGLVE